MRTGSVIIGPFWSRKYTSLKLIDSPSFYPKMNLIYYIHLIFSGSWEGLSLGAGISYILWKFNLLMYYMFF